ncbi:MAG: hypothetical protein H8E64_00120 [Candidatus Marinimicrobia bacterium]|nr:hypothetical protein [Candidatus Neomarinimicrobiota bacterium]
MKLNKTTLIIISISIISQICFSQNNENINIDSLIVSEYFNDVEGLKSPIFAAYLNLALPTTGYLYLGNWYKKAPPIIVLLTLGYGWGVHLETNINPDVPAEGEVLLGPSLIIVGSMWYAMIDGYRTAKKINEEKRKQKLLEIIKKYDK